MNKADFKKWLDINEYAQVYEPHEIELINQFAEDFAKQEKRILINNIIYEADLSGVDAIVQSCINRAEDES